MSHAVHVFTYASQPRYNNKTYRIDEIAWDHTPKNTFKKGGNDISFKEYYRQVGVPLV